MKKEFLLRCSHEQTYRCLVRALSGYTSGLVSSLASGDVVLQITRFRELSGRPELAIYPNWAPKIVIYMTFWQAQSQHRPG